MIANMSATVQLENAVNLQKSAALPEAGGATMMNHRSENKQKHKDTGMGSVQRMDDLPSPHCSRSPRKTM